MPITDMRISQFTSLSVAILSLTLVFCFSACSKINICGKEDKLVGDWKVSSYIIGGDSTVLLIDPSLFPDTFLLSSERPTIEFTADGGFNYITVGDTTFSKYRMERYERKCLIYVDLFDYNWEITKLGNVMEITSYYLFPMDSLVNTEFTLDKIN
ncbi:MAG: hypothetical protein ACI959_001786 [Limisphaerales bacterium]|jgi:hypothetical protein